MKSSAAIRTLVFVADPPIFARRGPRPHIPEVLPHVQMDQWPPAGIAGRLLARASRLPYVAIRQSRMASDATSALCLVDEGAGGPVEAFIDGHEFCHVLPLPEGTIHLTLPPLEKTFAIACGWAEEHPAARTGIVSNSLVTLYAPRDEDELAVALHLIESSWQFARGYPDGEALDD
ncbi:MAG TPA: hypothetical protein VKB88_24415 [Bryobacteraceae bacterium]|nr:hypothetical protein [Bryobacteraceae bacterium]